MAKYQIHPNEKEPAAYTNTIPKKRIQELKPKNTNKNKQFQFARICNPCGRLVRI